MGNGNQKLFRSRTDRIIFGVCGGLADYFNFDATIIRIIFILLAFNGFGVVLYLAMALIIPLEPAPGQTEDKSRPEPSSAGNSSEPLNGEVRREDKFREFAEDLGQRAREMAEEIKTTHPNWQNRGDNSRRDLLGLAIVAIGVLLLLKQIFPFSFHWFSWGFAWPLLIVLFGLFLLIKRK